MISPSQGILAGGTKLIITGRHLGESIEIKYGAYIAVSTSCSDESCEVITPPGYAADIGREFNISITSQLGETIQTQFQFSYIENPVDKTEEL